MLARGDLEAVGTAVPPVHRMTGHGGMVGLYLSYWPLYG